MPIYEYKCHKCGKTFEVRQRISEDHLTIHPDCGGEVEQLISAPALHFKGTGWYVTDYAKKNGKSSSSAPSESKSEAKSESKSESSSESKTESTSAPKTETKSESGTAVK
ncbi:MAG TPA: zinc ribbon domain-containing protein [Bryobacteraceae bacterium]|jgi:putative FmdB family regulatory protein|nr:zinc ribbon domain-containing protein [Bryobacteraceae bacterium]